MFIILVMFNCRRHFENVILTKVKPRRNDFNLYLHDCCIITLSQELMNFIFAKRKTQITETEFDSKTTSLTQNHIIWNNLKNLNFLNIVNTFKTHFTDKDHLTLSITNKELGTLNKVFTENNKKSIT